MSIPKSKFSTLIKEFKLKELFNELGWDNANAKYPINVDGRLYSLTGIAQKKEFLILLCTPQNGDGIPDAAARRKIDNQISKLHYEHLIIYVDANKTRQRWELMIREPNKPVVCRPIDYFAGQEPELLFQKLEGLFFSYEDEEKLSIVDVRSRVMANFEKNAEVVTKRFYERFSKEHKKFLSFINGIQSKVDQEWYASLMLNRLMFIYFIQKKGFLDNDRDYLRNRLKLVQQKKGKNKFYSFYRNFLLVLFHKGLGSPVRDPDLEAEIGKVPYLNGGLFDVHKLEQENKNITIEDKAFEHIFDFFDEYNWHLDTRITATGKDINPDVIGYIFEKYINDRAAMGAYYTKEDITEYISKNCIIPWLFDEVKRNYPKPFGRVEQDTILSYLQQSGDRYIYPAVKHGIRPNTTEANGFDDLPEDVRSCIDPNTPDLVEKRKCWNRPAPPEIALPTEIYREVIARRKRYYEVRKKIEQGEITEINDFITYNLNIRQFAQDVLEQTDDPKLIMEFYKAVRKITVLDPTCGSGAFLFAALNVLEPLYFACVTRMREFVEQDGKGKHKFFEEQLALIDSDQHPNEEYFIYKSIILHNLYGVDIMKEAVEIAKLRLFLKLVATVDVDYKKPNLGLEPLPDIDFNIRSGNTLVGYATLADLDKSAQGGLFGDEEKQAILEEADVVSRAYARFKDAQLVMYSNPKSYKAAKDELNKRLSVLNDKLNRYLAVTYLGPSHSKAAYEKWLASHQPFHWLAEYYWIIAEGGFDVIIGNPPYVEYSRVRESYRLLGYATLSTGNLYSFVVERSFQVLVPDGRLGEIVPLSLISTERMVPLQALVVSLNRTLWFSSFDVYPSKLFQGAKQRLTILLTSNRTIHPRHFATKYNRWRPVERETLFECIRYMSTIYQKHLSAFPKLEGALALSIYSKLLQCKPARFLRAGKKQSFFVHRIPYNYIKAIDFVPYFWNEVDGRKKSEDYKPYWLEDPTHSEAMLAILNSNLFFWWWYTNYEGYHCGRHEILSFPCNLTEMTPSLMSVLCELSIRLMNDLRANSRRKEAFYQKTGIVRYDEFYPRLSKHIIDEIDAVLGSHLGLSDEEVDYITSFDLKYRQDFQLVEEETENLKEQLEDKS